MDVLSSVLSWLGTFVLGLTTFVGLLFPAPSAIATQVLVVLVLVWAALALLALIGLAALIVTLVLARRRSAADGGEPLSFQLIVLDLTSFFAAAATPLAVLAQYVGSTLTTLWQLVVSNYRLMLGIALAFVLILGYTYGYPIVDALFAAIVAVGSFVWHVLLMNVVNIVRPFIDSAFLFFVNPFVVRLPGVLVTGTFFDLGSCSVETLVTFFNSTASFLPALGRATSAWGASGDAMLTTVPDFGEFSMAVGASIGTLGTLFTCVCASGSSVLVAPVLEAIGEGPPAPYALDFEGTDEITPFAHAINGTLCLIPAILTDAVRPFVLIGRGVAVGNLTAFQVLDGAAFSLNGTLDTLTQAADGVLGLATNIVQRYWVAFGRALTLGPVAGVDFPAPPPRIFECLRAVYTIVLNALRIVLNIIYRLGPTFTTFDGQLTWSLADVRDDIVTTIECLCDIIIWAGDVLRFYAAEIQGECTSSANCESPSLCTARRDYGRCLSENSSDFRACSSDTDCAVVDNFCTLGTCRNGHSTLALACTEPNPLVVDPGCQVCVFEVGSCSNGDVCTDGGDATQTQCVDKGTCANGTCALFDAYGQELELEQRFCLADGDCDRCFTAPAQCSGVCDGVGGSNVLADLGGCALSLVAGLFDVVCCLVRLIATALVDAIVLVYTAIIGTVYTVIARIGDLADTRCNVIAPGEEW